MLPHPPHPSRAALPCVWLMPLALQVACATDAATSGKAPTALTTATDAAAAVSPDPEPMAMPTVKPESELHELVGADWELEPNTEKYICVWQTMTETVYFDQSRGLSPVGTHHVVLSLSDDPLQPDGIRECDVATVGTHNVSGGGVGTRSRILPPGVAVKLPAGSQLLLNLHLFNASDEPLRGRSGTLIKAVDEKDVSVLTDAMIAGTTTLNVPPGRSTTTGKCTISQELTVFSVFPHMHQTGVALQAVAHTAARGDVVLFDGPYDFDDQQFYRIEMLPLKPGDVVDVTCTYENPRNQTLHWGGSSLDEMCQAGLGRIPAGGPSLCTK